jgi:hypothetical protein
MAASARFSWPLARSYLAVSVQDLMTADTGAARGLGFGLRELSALRVTPFPMKCTKVIASWLNSTSSLSTTRCLGLDTEGERLSGPVSCRLNFWCTETL